MNTHWTKLGLGVCALAALAGGASAQKASNAERGLLGINLYDNAGKVIALYGSPDEVQAVSIGASTNGGGNPGFGGPGFGGPGGRPGSGSPSGPPGGGGRGGGPAGGAQGADWMGQLGFGDELLRQQGIPGKGGGGRGEGGPRMGGPSGGGYPGAPGGRPGAGGPSGPGFPGGGGGIPNANGATETTQYTRWVYNRLGSKYGFIVDGQGHVVQIEAIGMQNNRVKTRKGVGFGATFAQIIKTYGNPDGYEVGGDTILMKYLVNKKIAFRLTRLEAKKPHVVTGVVVSAGKV